MKNDDSYDDENFLEQVDNGKQGKLFNLVTKVNSAFVPVFFIRKFDKLLSKIGEKGL